jgi:hypothetical protein
MRIRAGKRTAIAVTVLLFGGGALGLSAAAASASGIPVVNVQGSGEAGYFAANDLHTHYRYVQAIVTAQPTLNDLNGAFNAALPVSPSNQPGAVGVELCNPDDGYGAQVGLWDDGGVYTVSYDDGAFVHPGAGDKCIDSGFVDPTAITVNKLLLNGTVIQPGDKILLSVYYNPARRVHGPRTQFTACDLSQFDACSQQHGNLRGTEELTSFGIGAVTQQTNLTAPALNNLMQYTSAEVNFYSSARPPYPIADQKAYYGIGGLAEVQFENSSTQVVMSPNGSLSGSTFTLYEGSTSS